MGERVLETGDTEDMRAHILASCAPWDEGLYAEYAPVLPSGWWAFVRNRDELAGALGDFPGATVWFLHWSWRVPPAILAARECVCFHMTDLPYGRGGTPLQNLVLRGHTETMLTAFRMVEELDAGPIYCKERLTLEGSAQEIYERASRLAFGMIRRIIAEKIEPVPQTGEPVYFARRSAPFSEIQKDLRGPVALYDFIRMLDAEGYPQAFLDYGGFRFTFSGARIEGERVMAHVEMARHE